MRPDFVFDVDVFLWAVTDPKQTAGLSNAGVTLLPQPPHFPEGNVDNLDVEAELHDIAVFDDVFFAFDSQFAGLARLGERA